MSSSNHSSTPVGGESIELLCIRNLLASDEERIYFKDHESRFLMVSEGWLATAGGGRTLESVIGKTDFDIFSAEHAAEAVADEQKIMATGRSVIAKTEYEKQSDGSGTWVSTTKFPLRDRQGVIIGTFGISRDITTQVHAQDDLTFRALHDPLTGLLNRTALSDRLAQALVGLERGSGRVGIVFIDLDGFKAVNDRSGHDAGDRMLVEIAERLTRVARRGDSVCRLGGDEFVIMCPGLHARDDLREIGGRVIKVLRAPMTRSLGLSITASVGVADTSDPATALDKLLREADHAMYAAKSAGGDRCELHETIFPRLASSRFPGGYGHADGR